MSKRLPAAEAANALLSSVWPLVARVNGEFHPHGTGFLISYTGLLLSARHVVEDPAKARQRMMGPDGKFISEGQFYALVPPRTGEDGVVRAAVALTLDHMDFSKRGDIAVCHVNPVGRGALPTDAAALMLHPGLPRMGDEVSVFGYRKIDISVREETETELAIHWKPDVMLVGGRVEEVHLPRKLHSISDFPAITISADIGGGMSGGPVLNSQGRVIAVTSHSPDWEHTGTAALVGFALATTVTFPSGNESAPRRTLLRDLVGDGTVGADESADDVELEPLCGDDYHVTVRAPR